MALAKAWHHARFSPAACRHRASDADDADALCPVGGEPSLRLFPVFGRGIKLESIFSNRWYSSGAGATREAKACGI